MFFIVMLRMGARRAICREAYMHRRDCSKCICLTATICRYVYLINRGAPNRGEPNCAN